MRKRGAGAPIPKFLCIRPKKPSQEFLFYLGRQILEGRPEVRIYGKPYKVRAYIARIEGFSDHADKDDLLRWLKAFEQPPRRLFLTHGEGDAALSPAKLIEEQSGWSVVVPFYRDVYELEEVKTP